VTGSQSLGQKAPQVQGVAQPGREMGHVAPDAHAVEHERPEDWGWHGETGRWGRIGGWFAVFATLTYLIGNHEGRVEDFWVVGTALLMVIILLWDRRRRKNAWRAR
jgi:hypothetical protein